MSNQIGQLMHLTSKDLMSKIMLLFMYYLNGQVSILKFELELLFEPKYLTGGGGMQNHTICAIFDIRKGEKIDLTHCDVFKVHKITHLHLLFYTPYKSFLY